VVVVAMSLSKIYRGAEAGDLKEFRFRSFGEGEPQPPFETAGFKTAEISAPVAARTASPPVDHAGQTAHKVEEAYARGRQEGMALVEARLESTTQALTQALEDVSRLRESLALSGTQDMLRLVMAVAEQVVRRQIEVDPGVILAVIKDALQASVRADSYRIRINPADLEAVTRQKPLFLASISGLKNLSIETDSSIAPGGCRVDSELGDVEATIEGQLAAIRQALAEAITEG
jgi:flagellar assembly protein FliH